MIVAIEIEYGCLETGIARGDHGRSPRALLVWPRYDLATEHTCSSANPPTNFFCMAHLADSRPPETPADKKTNLSL